MDPFEGGPRRGNSQMMSKHLSLRYVVVLKKATTLVWTNQKIDFWGVCFRVVPEGLVPPNYVKILISKISTADIKKHWQRKLSPSKKMVWGGSQKGGDTPKPRQNICILNIYWQQKTLGP